MWKGVVPISGGVTSGVLGDASPKFRLYGLGWSAQDYRGHKIISHGGGVLGSIATIVLIPEKNIGFAIMINSEDSALLAGLQNTLLDHYLGLPGRDWPKAYKDFLDARSQQAVAAVKASTQTKPTSKPSLPLSGYAGTYADPWYGPMSIAEKDGRLCIDFQQTPQMKGPLEHWAYDTFVARFPGSGTTEPAYVTFALGADGKPQADHHEGGLADRRLQLRLPPPGLHPRRRQAVRPHMSRSSVVGVVGFVGLLGSFVAPLTASVAAESAAAAYDLVIRNGRVLDGAGNPWVRADVAVKDGRIARVGTVEGKGAREIDAEGRYVSPGWIDMMDQSGGVLLKNGAAENKLRMGVTTLIARGGGHAGRGRRDPGYFTRLETQGIGVNFGTYYSAVQARVDAMGEKDGAPDAGPDERDEGRGRQGDEGRRLRHHHGPDLSAVELRLDARADRAGQGGRALRRLLRQPHARRVRQAGRGGAARPSRSARRAASRSRSSTSRPPTCPRPGS